MKVKISKIKNIHKLKINMNTYDKNARASIISENTSSLLVTIECSDGILYIPAILIKNESRVFDILDLVSIIKIPFSKYNISNAILMICERYYNFSFHNLKAEDGNEIIKICKFLQIDNNKLVNIIVQIFDHLDLDFDTLNLYLLDKMNFNLNCDTDDQFYIHSNMVFDILDQYDEIIKFKSDHRHSIYEKLRDKTFDFYTIYEANIYHRNNIKLGKYAKFSINIIVDYLFDNNHLKIDNILSVLADFFIDQKYIVIGDYLQCYII